MDQGAISGAEPRELGAGDGGNGLPIIGQGFDCSRSGADWHLGVAGHAGLGDGSGPSATGVSLRLPQSDQEPG
jgi:hypothetical protein